LNQHILSWKVCAGSSKDWLNDERGSFSFETYSYTGTYTGRHRNEGGERKHEISSRNLTYFDHFIRDSIKIFLVKMSCGSKVIVTALLHTSSAVVQMISKIIGEGDVPPPPLATMVWKEEGTKESRSETLQS
jgi:hypothetical protein